MLVIKGSLEDFFVIFSETSFLNFSTSTLEWKMRISFIWDIFEAPIWYNAQHCKGWYEKNLTHPKICFYKKIHNFYLIFMKLCQNKVLMSTPFWLSFVMIGYKLWIFIKSIFLGESGFFLSPLILVMSWRYQISIQVICSKKSFKNILRIFWKSFKNLSKIYWRTYEQTSKQKQTKNLSVKRMPSRISRVSSDSISEDL